MIVYPEIQRPERCNRAGDPLWSSEENRALRELHPRLEVTVDDLMELMPWRSKYAIYNQTRRLGIKKESLLEHILRRSAQ